MLRVTISDIERVLSTAEILPMPSPFFSVDPCLKNSSTWMDFSERFVASGSDALSEWLPLCRPLPTADYFANIVCVNRRIECDVDLWSVCQPLLPVPIRQSSPECDLQPERQALFSLTLEGGLFRRALRKRAPPLAPLADNDLQQAAALAAAGAGERRN